MKAELRDLIDRSEQAWDSGRMKKRDVVVASTTLLLSTAAFALAKKTKSVVMAAAGITIGTVSGTIGVLKSEEIARGLWNRVRRHRDTL